MHTQPRLSNIDLNSWKLGIQSGSTEDPTPEEDFIFFSRDVVARGVADEDPSLIPSIYSLHGHDLPGCNAFVTYLERGHKAYQCLVTLALRVVEYEGSQVREYDAFVLTVPAWQGDNNIVHLIEALPMEELDNFDYQNALTLVDLMPGGDYLERLQAEFSDDELVAVCPTVFFMPDPSSNRPRISIREQEQGHPGFKALVFA